MSAHQPPLEYEGESLHIPTSVAVILDGNKRWAEERGLSAREGHRKGTENIQPIIRAFGSCGVQYLTLYAFSTENWKRPKKEVRDLMKIFSGAFDKHLQPIHEAGIRLVHIGSRKGISRSIRKKIDNATRLTQNNTKMTLCLAFNYGGRAEIVNAVRQIAKQDIDPQDIDEDTIQRHLWTHNIPDPDLLIRTGNEQRTSNFLVWQIAGSETIFLKKYWPDFTPEDVQTVLAEYSRRVTTCKGTAMQ